MGRAAHGITKQSIRKEMNPTSLDRIDASCLLSLTETFKGVSFLTWGVML